jgi:nucleotide-binding universal stress UspA family protein
MWLGRDKQQTTPAVETAPRQDGPKAASLEKLLLVVDGSEPSLAAARYAVTLATQLGSRLTAVYIVDTATMDFLTQTRIFVAEERDEFEHDLERTGQRYLEYVKTLAGKAGLGVDTVLGKGSLHRTVLQIATDRQVNAIVIGGFRRSIMRKDLPSVERQLILDEAECPVIVVKAVSTPADKTT